MADPWPQGPSVAVMTGRTISIPGEFAGNRKCRRIRSSTKGLPWSCTSVLCPTPPAPVEHAVIPKGLPRSCTSVPCPTPPAVADPATSRPPRPGRVPDITPRSTSRPDHVRAVRAGDDVREAATLDAERGVPAAIPPAWSRSSAAAMSSSWSSRMETTCPAPRAATPVARRGEVAVRSSPCRCPGAPPARRQPPPAWLVTSAGAGRGGAPRLRGVRPWGADPP